MTKLKKRKTIKELRDVYYKDECKTKLINRI